MVLDAEKVHKGGGSILYNGELVGEARNVGFILQKLGLAGEGDETRTCYGTVSGVITKKQVIDELNNPAPTPVEMRLELEGEEKKGVHLAGVEFIDDIPRDGELDEVEFDGTLED